MHLVIVSGLSGSGKSTALNALEDAGYNCIDNLPVSLLPALITQIQLHKDADNQNFAIGIDIRDAWQDLEIFPSMVGHHKDAHLPFTVVFLDAETKKIVQRFSETRRKHPLSDKHRHLTAAIETEHQLLEPMRDAADLVINTTDLNLHQLRELIKSRIAEPHSDGMAVLFESFGFKHGPPNNADIVFDARCLPNPHWKQSLRSQTGRDVDVIDFLDSEPLVQDMLQDITHFLGRWWQHYQANNRSYITVAIGCTGGQHRSVYLCDKLQQQFSGELDNVQVRHRELDAPQ
ncbi:RNase adapter RapZ [Gilvimarinus agarilyticus]|uniref:RNase adapter RapZ n=1 Tax=unclassified Gilvimarinus TaxID=2642066 RepID=UPI001C09B520|nr:MULTISPECIES: RNase adapter RapZ [unclassified Gilvimarinus]MBU2885438.1 RNase adapter RapZ [Gilvimarinus agarilyticus]MDO6570338.1 RNase adapter RapZ [Gilvimarinus sp. 2_MG-2023]MDO6746875.1 RNase adapter RapZ [Gilvimarinus sp. 1_MG-2023]